MFILLIVLGDTVHHGREGMVMEVPDCLHTLLLLDMK